MASVANGAGGRSAGWQGGAVQPMTFSEPVRIIGMRLATTMTVLRLDGDALLVHSPVPLTDQRRAEVTARGRVAHLYSPNVHHHRWLGEWSKAFPDARVHAPAALARKRPDLRIDRPHDLEGEPAFEGLLDEVHLDGFRLEETVLVHRASRTLVVADLVQNIGRPVDPWTRLYSGLMGFYDRVALSRAIRWTAISNRRAFRRSLDQLLALDFDRMLVGHGAPVPDAKPALREAFGRLAAVELPVRAGRFGLGDCG